MVLAYAFWVTWMLIFLYMTKSLPVKRPSWNWNLLSFYRCCNLFMWSMCLESPPCNKSSVAKLWPHEVACSDQTTWTCTDLQCFVGILNLQLIHVGYAWTKNVVRRSDHNNISEGCSQNKVGLIGSPEWKAWVKSMSPSLQQCESSVQQTLNLHEWLVGLLNSVALPLPLKNPSWHVLP